MKVATENDAFLDAAYTDDPPVELSSRIAGALVLLAVVGISTWIAVELTLGITDAWAAPLSLSPDSETVLQLRGRLAEQRAQRDRLASELERTDARLVSVGRARARIAELRRDVGALARHRANESQRSAAGAAEQTRLLTTEAEALAAIVQGLENELETAGRAREAGLVDNATFETRRRFRDEARLRLATAQRELRRAHELERFAHERAVGLAPAEERTVVPESFEQHEHALRLELEDLELESEEEILRSTRATLVEHVTEAGALLATLEARPQVRAMHTRVDLLFVPYEELAGVHAGSAVMQCAGGLVLCRAVGTVIALVPGELVTEGPFGERERGQLVEIRLSDAAARRATTLRVRER